MIARDRDNARRRERKGQNCYPQKKPTEKEKVKEFLKSKARLTRKYPSEERSRQVFKTYKTDITKPKERHRQLSLGSTQQLRTNDKYINVICIGQCTRKNVRKLRGNVIKSYVSAGRSKNNGGKIGGSQPSVFLAIFAIR